MSVNMVALSGNLTRDIEVRTTASGTPIGSFGIAVNDRRKSSQTGEWEDYANFFECTMFGSRAESLRDRLTKGTRVMVSGKLHYSQWERDGQRRSKVDVTVDDIDFAPRRGDVQDSSAPDADPQPSAYDADIPF